MCDRKKALHLEKLYELMGMWMWLVKLWVFMRLEKRFTNTIHLVGHFVSYHIASLGYSLTTFWEDLWRKTVKTDLVVTIQPYVFTLYPQTCDRICGVIMAFNIEFRINPKSNSLHIMHTVLSVHAVLQSNSSSIYPETSFSPKLNNIYFYAVAPFQFQIIVHEADSRDTCEMPVARQPVALPDRRLRALFDTNRCRTSMIKI